MVARRCVRTDAAPAAIGPYSQALGSGPWLFLSGQIGLRPEGGALVDGGVAAEAEQALDNLCRVLEADGLSFGDVVRVTIYLADLADFATVNEIYERYVESPPPARSTIGVAALPKGARIEIDAIACAPDGA
jgi:2-iminobutanoate/2-iminopropanoate deaminase